jgi:hypothetical protein
MQHADSFVPRKLLSVAHTSAGTGGRAPVLESIAGPARLTEVTEREPLSYTCQSMRDTW